jgi:hypothetical protein
MLAINHKKEEVGWSLLRVTPSEQCCAEIWDLAHVPYFCTSPLLKLFILRIICWLLPTLIKILHQCFSKSFTSLNIEVICKVTLSFTPSPLFQWYPQNNEISLNLSVKCWNSSFNAQGSRLIIVIVQIGLRRSSENICSSSGGAQEKRKEGMKLSLLPKLVEKLVWAAFIYMRRDEKFQACTLAHLVIL